MLLRGYKPKPYVEKDARIVKIATRPGHRPVQASIMGGCPTHVIGVSGTHVFCAP